MMSRERRRTKADTLLRMEAAASEYRAPRRNGEPPALRRSRGGAGTPRTLKEVNVYIVQTYVAYLLISIALTVWVARTLHKNGRVFLIESFGGQATLADSVNQLLVVGFYLINIGFVVFALKESRRPQDLAETIEALSTKVGLVLLVLGFMHFFNLLVFSRLRKRDALRHLAPPLLPQERLAPADSRASTEPREKARS